MSVFLLNHEHAPHECEPAFAAWQGFESPLRHGHVLSTCLSGGHRLFWLVEATDVREALSHLPRFVAERTVPTQVRRVELP
jgi:hypothetical protein